MNALRNTAEPAMTNELPDHVNTCRLADFRIASNQREIMDKSGGSDESISSFPYLVQLFRSNNDIDGKLRREEATGCKKATAPNGKTV